MAEGHRRYDPIEIEARWQARWHADRPHDLDLDRVAPGQKFYNLVEFPYPSAEGLHVGHAYTYSGADIYGRWLRMRGRAVFQPIGFDSFGIHTENYALRTGQHPAALTARTIANYRRQLRRLGVAWDWRHELVTSDPRYYRWTQWIFLKLLDAGLAVRREAPVVWCPSCLTVLAYEQLEGDRCERCGTRVTQRVMRQWFLRITAYADQLLDGLDGLDWPEEAKRVQREWIGRSRGVEVDFELAGGKGRLSTFTTRPDTLFGVTFLVVPPDHPELAALAAGTGQEAAVRAFAERTREQAELRAVQARERGGAAARPVTPRGVFTGAVASHPATGAALPVWVADYVVSDYGTGAVMGVPGHDQRDHRFAQAQGLPVVEVVRPAASQGLPWTGPGVLVASGRFSGMPSGQAASAVAEWLQATGRGRRVTRYRLHDWLISRQRYWGPPIPVVDCGACGPVGVPEAELPVLLPDVADFRPSGSGRSPLAAVESFVRTACPACGGPATRETDVSDTFLDSAWYFLRYPSAGRRDVAWDPDLTARWLPVDLYAGGPEHVARHHLYARFVTHALHDLGLVPFAEPFPRIRLHGVLRKDGAKMSKSRGNVVVPEDYIDRVGADTLRLYLAFCAPWEEGGDFGDRDIAGIERFLARLWQLLAGGAGPTGSEPPGRGSGEDPAGSGGSATGATDQPHGSGVDLRPLDRTVHAVGRDIGRLKFNTAIAALMELVRWAGRQRPRMAPGEWERTARTLLLLLAPFAPHQAEELWARRGYRGSVHLAGWPPHDPHALEETQVTLVVQVDGRRRDARPAPAGASREQALEIALASDRVRRHLPGGAPRGVVFVPDRLINLLT